MASDSSILEMNMKNNDSMGGGMQMYFYFGNNATILFGSWKVSTPKDMAWSCIVILIMAFLYEGLKVLRQSLLRYAKVQPTARDRHSDMTSDDDQVLLVYPHVGMLSRRASRIVLHVIQTLLHAVQLIIGYALMLIIMTYNAWLFFSVIIGAALGYLVFNYCTVFAEEIQDPCH